MNKTVLLVGLLAITAIFGAAQDTKTLPPVTLKQNTAISSYVPSHPHTRTRTLPDFCPASSCLYYGGDFDSTWSGANGLFNYDDTGANEMGQAWVGVKPDRDVTVTGATFVELNSGGDIINPTPFVVQEGITVGKAGKTVCSTSGNATVTAYQQILSELDYAYTIQTLSKPCKLKKRHVYYVNLMPISTDEFGYVVNTPPKDPPNHYGWKNDNYDCYFNSASFNLDYVNCSTQGEFPAFGVALTGKKTN